MPSLMRQVSIIFRCASMFRGDKLKERGSDLGTCHHSYILLLCRNPGISQDAIAKKICINKSNVTRHMSQLEKLGYVERRQSDEDKRMMLVYPTQKAYDALPDVKDIVHEWKEYITEGISKEELEMATEILHRMAKRAAEYAARDLDSEDSE